MSATHSQPTTPSSPLSPQNDPHHPLQSPSFNHPHSGAVLDHLAFAPCTFSQFWDLPIEDRRRYDLIEGVLQPKLEMSDVPHKDIQAYLNIRLARYNATRAGQLSRVSVLIDCGIEIPSALSRDTQRFADVVIGPYESANEKGRRSPNSKKLHYPLRKSGKVCPNPFVVIEVTSSNYKTDLNEKVDDYAKRGIKYYVIIDRKQCCVWLYSAPKSSKYTITQKFVDKQVIPADYLKQLGVTAEECLNPSRTAEDLIESPERRAIDAEREKKHLQSRASAAEREKNNLQRENKDLQSRASAAEREKNNLQRQLEELKREVAYQTKKRKHGD